jgi:pimeloyl-ACP methyl ester carboxylesterase
MRQLARDGVALAFKDVGKGAPPILLVHDQGSDHSSFGPQIEHFRRDHRVVAVDLRGHGQSGGQKSGQTPAELASDIAWLCYELGVHLPAVVGHGLGGAVALEMATRYPDLPAAVVALDTPIGPPAETGSNRHSLSDPFGVPLLYVDAGGEATDLGHLREMCPHLTVSRFEEAGHRLHLEWPEQINALIESFLARISGTHFQF